MDTIDPLKKCYNKEDVPDEGKVKNIIENFKFGFTKNLLKLDFTDVDEEVFAGILKNVNCLNGWLACKTCVKDRLISIEISYVNNCFFMVIWNPHPFIFIGVCDLKQSWGFHKK